MKGLRKVSPSSFLEKLPVLQPGAKDLDRFRVADMDMDALEKSPKGRSGPQPPRPGRNHPSPTHRSERSLIGAVRVTAAITIVISPDAR